MAAGMGNENNWRNKGCYTPIEVEILKREETESENANLESRVRELEAERDRLKLENDVLESMSRHAPSSCGHSSQYAYTDDGGKHIVCLLCSRSRHAALVEAASKCIPKPCIIAISIEESERIISELKAALAKEVKP